MQEKTNSENEKMYLYWGSGSIPCWKAMIVLEEKGLSGYPNKLISFSDKEHKGEDVMKLNSRGQVPTFKDGDTIVNESNAICFYLERKFSAKGQKLLPADPSQYARVIQKVFEVGNIETSLMKNIFYYHFVTEKDKLDQELLKTRYQAAREELKLWDEYLAQSDGYLVGSDFTMADVFFFPYIVYGVRVALKLDQFPAIKAYYEKVKERDSIKASWPPHWKEEPGKLTYMSEV